MTSESLNNRDWQSIVEKLGGAEDLAKSARETKAFQRPRTITSAVDLLRIILAYCLGQTGLRATSAWASAVGLAELSNVALLQRLRRSGDWLADRIVVITQLAENLDRGTVQVALQLVPVQWWEARLGTRPPAGADSSPP